MLNPPALSRRTWGPPFVAKANRQLLGQLDVAEQVHRIGFVMDAQGIRGFLRPLAVAIQAIATTHQQTGPDQNSELNSQCFAQRSNELGLIRTAAVAEDVAECGSVRINLVELNRVAASQRLWEL